MTLREQIAAASAKATWDKRVSDNHFLALLWKAYRAGKLLVIEDEQEAVRRMAGAIENVSPCYPQAAATAALAALKGGVE